MSFYGYFTFLGKRILMIEKLHKNGNVFSKAVYSYCLSYRYSLMRTWSYHQEKIHFIMLNPSTATEIQNDPTVERCERRARSLNYGAFCVTNIFAWHSPLYEPLPPHTHKPSYRYCTRRLLLRHMSLCFACPLLP